MNEQKNKNQLSKEWKKVTLGEVATYINGKAFKPSEWSREGLPIIRIQNLNREKSEFNYCNFKVDEKFFVNKGDLLFAWSGTPDTSFGAHIWKGGKAVLNQHIFKILIDKNQIEKQYYLYALNHKVKEFVSKAHGTAGLAHITKKKFEESEIYLPSKPTQQAIVFKIEELFSELDKGIENLRTAQQQLKTYRQSVLKWAFEGKLTNENVKEGELPNGWKLLKFGGLFFESPQNGLYKSSTEYGSGTPIIRIDGFYDGLILDDYEYKRVRLTDEEINRYLISVGDILVNRVNSMPYLGKCGIVKYLKEKTVFESNVMKVRLDEKIALPEYFTMYLSSKKGITELRKNAKQAVNQASINQTDVSNVMVPLPLIKEQHNIVQEIESRLSVADKMEESISQSLQQAEALRQSILKKAFEGRLIN